MDDTTLVIDNATSVLLLTRIEAFDDYSEQQVETLHVQQRHTAHQCPEQLRIAGEHDAHEQTAVAAAFDREPVSACVFRLDERFRAGDKVVKHVLFFCEASILVPGGATKATAFG